MAKLNCNNIKGYSLMLLMLAIIGGLLMGCTGGSSQAVTAKSNDLGYGHWRKPSSEVNTTPGSDSTNVPQFITLINKGTANGDTLTVESVTIDFYNQANNCTGNISYIAKGGETEANIDIYTTTDQSNYLLCESYPGGCNKEFENVQSISITDRYSFAPLITQVCISGPIQNNGLACTTKMACGFSSEQRDSINPGSGIIFITESTYAGDFCADCGWDEFDGADAKCMADANNPLGAGYGKWKALLNGAKATESGILYVRLDGTEVATATRSGNLNFPNLLANSISTLHTQVWGGGGNDCALWHSSNSDDTGMYGWADASNYNWMVMNIASCSTSLSLYCAEN